jgi:hypothetical protein
MNNKPTTLTSTSSKVPAAKATPAAMAAAAPVKAKPAVAAAAPQSPKTASPSNVEKVSKTASTSVKPNAASVKKTDEKAKKSKLVRDSFTMPKAEYLQIEALKARALKASHAVKKSELLRAGLAALSAMNDAALLAALKAVAPLTTGRPKKSK